MRILELCLSRGHGGLELYPIKIMEWLRDELDLVIAIVAPDSFISKQLDNKKIDYQVLKCTSFFETIAAAIRISIIIRKNKIDVLHINSGPDLKLSVLAKLLSFNGVKLVYTRHLEIERIDQHNRKVHDKYKGVYHRILFRYVDLFIGVTQRVVNEANEHLPLPKEKIRLLYNGIPDAPPSGQENCDRLFNDLDIAPGSFVIGQFSRIEYEKGQRVVVDAVSSLISKGRNVQHVMIGNVSDGEYYQELKDSIDRLHLGSSIKFLNYYPDPMKIMGCFDVIIVASYAETFGLVLAEAMRCGTLVIGTNNGGIPEIIDHDKTGLLFEPGNSDELEAIIDKIINDERLRVKISKGGKSKADRLFSQQKHFSDFQKMLKDLV